VGEGKITSTYRTPVSASPSFLFGPFLTSSFALNDAGSNGLNFMSWFFPEKVNLRLKKEKTADFN